MGKYTQAALYIKKISMPKKDDVYCHSERNS